MTKIDIWIRSAFQSEFRRNTVWYTALTGFERIIAVMQTILISRALGITEYGVYGLLFGTIGLVASVVGLQMGLTATVFVARYKLSEQSKVAAVISIVGRFGWIVALVLLLLAAPFTSQISRFLLASPAYQLPALLGALFVGGSIISGIQDGVAQGFELFSALAKVKIVASVLVLAAILPMAAHFGLAGVLSAILGGLTLKYAALYHLVRRARRVAAIPAIGAGVSFRSLVSGFALPAMLVSLGVGLVTWSGMFLLSRQPGGFDGVAIVNTGLQWRGPVLLLTASIGAVAVPAFSRLHASANVAQTARLRGRLSLFNLLITAAAAIVLVTGSGLILALYGEGFQEGQLAFSLIVLSTIPAAVANVYMQQLVGAAKMWRQLWLHCPFLVVMCTCFMFLVPRYHAAGYSISILVGAVVFLAHILIADFSEVRENTKDLARNR